MLPLDKVGTWRPLSGGDLWQLWAYTRTIDRQRFGPAAATGVALLNSGNVPLHIQNMEVRWPVGTPVSWHRPGLVEPGESWTLLDPRSFDSLIALARQHGRRGFGVEGVVHEVVVHLDQPRPARLAFEVSWGFATPGYDLGFFLPALDEP